MKYDTAIPEYLKYALKTTRTVHKENQLGEILARKCRKDIREVVKDDPFLSLKMPLKVPDLKDVGDILFKKS